MSCHSAAMGLAPALDVVAAALLVPKSAPVRKELVLSSEVSDLDGGFKCILHAAVASTSSLKQLRQPNRGMSRAYSTRHSAWTNLRDELCQKSLRADLQVRTCYVSLV